MGEGAAFDYGGDGDFNEYHDVDYGAVCGESSPIGGAPPTEKEQLKQSDFERDSRSRLGGLGAVGAASLPEISSVTALIAALAQVSVALQSQSEWHTALGLQLALHACDGLYALVSGHAVNQAALGSAGGCSHVTVILRFAAKGAAASAAGASLGSQSAPSSLPSSSSAFLSLIEKALRCCASHVQAWS